MNTKELINTEIELITKIVNKNIEERNWKIALSKELKLITVTINRTKEEFYLYSFRVTANNKEYRFTDYFSSKAEVLRISWNITYQIWSKLDKNINSNLAERLWPKNNGFLPNHEK